MKLKRFGLVIGLGLVWLVMGTAGVARADDLTVCPDGPPACDYAVIQEAVDAAAPGDTVKVATGVYTGTQGRPAPPGYSGPSVITQVVYISKTVTIRGGYTVDFVEPPDPEANPTTLDALNRGRVVYITGDISPTVEGLRITGGDAKELNGNGGGVFVVNATVTLRNNLVFGNAAYCGGGLYLSDCKATFNANIVSYNAAGAGWFSGGGLYLSDCEATFEENTISFNQALVFIPPTIASPLVPPSYGGGLIAVGGTLTLTGNNISYNLAGTNGGGLYLSSGESTGSFALINNLISYNKGGGLALFDDSETRLPVRITDNTIIANTVGAGVATMGGAPTLINNLIAHNQTHWCGGGMVIWSGAPTLINNLIVGNQASANGSGSALYLSSDAFPHLWHNTIVGNTGGDGSGIYVSREESASALWLTNTILVSHSVGITVEAGSTATLNATLWGNDTDWAGPGTIITGMLARNYWGNPDFLDPDAGDYHIGPTSAALDRGVPTTVTTDIDGDPRPYGPGYDLGADEYLPPPPNQAPYVPSNPDPTEGAVDVPLTPTLSWQGGDPDGDPVTYTVAFGASDPPPVAGQVGTTSYDPGLLTGDATYYWAITASDGLSTTAGPTWSFSTALTPCVQVAGLGLMIVTTGTIYAGDTVAFQVDVSPDDAGKPYTYTVSVAGQTVVQPTASGDDPLEFAHTFPSTGTYDVEVAVWNCQMSTPVTGVIQIRVYEPGTCVEVEGVDLTLLGPSHIYAGDTAWFSADLAPDDASLPYTYTVHLDGMTLVYPQEGNIDPLEFAHSFLVTGSYTVEVSVWNCGRGKARAVRDALEVEVVEGYRVFLPVVIGQN